MYLIMSALANAAGETAETIRATQGHILRNLAGWRAGLVTLRSIAASLWLRSEGDISNLIKRCEEAFGENAALRDHHDHAIAALRA